MMVFRLQKALKAELLVDICIRPAAFLFWSG
jgi:hypothetical protein